MCFLKMSLAFVSMCCVFHGFHPCIMMTQITQAEFDQTDSNEDLLFRGQYRIHQRTTLMGK
jgi:hypothetical protein